MWLGLGVRVESIENGDPIRTDGEQARPNSSCSILRISHPRRATCPRRRNRSQMPRPQRTAGISITIILLDPIQIHVYARLNYLISNFHSQCSFVEHRNYKIVYRRYASLFFLVGVDDDEVNKSFSLCCIFNWFIKTQ